MITTRGFCLIRPFALFSGLHNKHTNNTHKTKSVDVFSAGCVLHYLVYGSHPFGPHYERESNIRRGSRQLQQGDSALDHLIQRMIRHRYQDRLVNSRFRCL